jgi:CheY-like chemotaxis protein
VASAGDGLEAIIQVGMFNPDVVVLDIMMPRMDGLTVLGHLRRQPTTAALPVVLLSAKADSTDISIGLRAGASDYVTKPFEGDDLLQRTRKALVTPVAMPMAATPPAAVPPPPPAPLPADVPAPGPTPMPGSPPHDADAPPPSPPIPPPYASIHDLYAAPSSVDEEPPDLRLPEHRRGPWWWAAAAVILVLLLGAALLQGGHGVAGIDTVRGWLHL